MEGGRRTPRMAIRTERTETNLSLFFVMFCVMNKIITLFMVKHILGLPGVCLILSTIRSRVFGNGPHLRFIP